MFTKTDLISYLSDLEAMETNMRDLYSATADLVDDKNTKKILLDLAKIEQGHKDLVTELRTLAIKQSITEN